MSDTKALRSIIDNAKNIVFFGGAGVSTESGIPDFRGTGGIYTNAENDTIPPELILHRNYFMKHPGLFYDYYRNHMLFPDTKPNKAHLTLAKLEKEGRLSAVITQNIDGLHQKAGSENVIELHGSTLRNYCMKCGKKYGPEIVLQSIDYPTCDKCGGIIKPDVVLYGESLDTIALYSAVDAISRADVLIVGGTSLTVQPAASLVEYFRGKHLILINKSETPYDDMAEFVFREPIGELFGKLYDIL